MRISSQTGKKKGTIATMGERIPPVEWPLGDSCFQCEGEGKPFDEGKTPKYMRCYFEGMTACWPGAGFPDPPNGIEFHLEQFTPCTWRHGEGPGWHIRYETFGPYEWCSSAFLSFLRPDETVLLYFKNQSILNECCQMDFINMLSCNYPTRPAIGGWCHIGWGGRNYQAMDAMNITPMYNLRFEHRPISPELKVDKYCDKKVPMNIKILYVPE